MAWKKLIWAASVISFPVFAQTTPTTTPAKPAFDAQGAKMRIDEILEKTYPELDALYKDIHAHPELGFKEFRTAGILASKMRKLGFDVTERVGGTGIVAVFKNGDGPTVMVRTELDALPMEEKTGLSYASKVQTELDGKSTFVAHSCGHDSHMAWWVGTAQALVAMKERWKGTLIFVGQPAEELGGGAKAMLADGLFTRWPKPDYAFAAHVAPLPAGMVITKAGAVSTAFDEIDITFRGQGAHGSMPDKSIDPIVMGSRFVSDVQTVISREKAPGTFGVVTVGAFQSGSAGNIIPDEAKLKVTLRSRDDDTRKLLIDGVGRTARAVAEMSRAPFPIIERPIGTSVVLNDPGLSDRAAKIMLAAFGGEALYLPASLPGGEASEDYSEFVAAGTRSIYFAIGGDDPAMLARYKAEGKAVPVNHSPFFAPMPKPAIERGVETLTLAVLMVAGVQVSPSVQ